MLWPRLRGRPEAPVSRQVRRKVLVPSSLRVRRLPADLPQVPGEGCMAVPLLAFEAE